MDKALGFLWFYARKGTAAFIVSGLGAVGTAASDGTILGQELVTALGVALLAATAVYRTNNHDENNRVEDEGQWDGTDIDNENDTENEVNI